MALFDRTLRLLMGLSLPPRCPVCGVVVGDDHQFCSGCWSAMTFLGPPGCAACNRPFAYDRGPGARCAACIADPPRHAGICAAVAYDDVSRGLALRLKYGRRTGLGETMARHIVRTMPAGVDLLVPVPLHRWRLWSRGFNQALVMALAIARRTGVPVDRHALVRTRATPSLKGLGRKARARAVAGVFAVAPEHGMAVRGKAVGLVDDVYSSGATTDAATRVLLAAGARSVTILCWARVLDAAADD
ncbi:amidophosphoribosyltransferase [Sphingomonas sp. Leaf17]|nr:ComF family protein [Sphingomonas sp. Leaf17]KQM63638.1 amidophosphoribosyltransferase [Sphingomonas sp. Leaf17]